MTVATACRFTVHSSVWFSRRGLNPVNSIERTTQRVHVYRFVGHEVGVFAMSVVLDKYEKVS
jgi:hypothetical protein